MSKIEWRHERHLVEGRFVYLVLCGYGSAARYVTNNNGWPKHFTLAEARECTQQRNAEPLMRAAIAKASDPHARDKL